MNLRTWVRVLIAVSFAVSGLAATLSATGLVVEFSPDGRWGPGVHTLAVGGPLQIVGAAVLASGRKTRWVLGFLVCYVFLGSVIESLPLISNPDVRGTAIAVLLGNLAVMGGILYWLRGERIPPALPPVVQLARDPLLMGKRETPLADFWGRSPRDLLQLQHAAADGPSSDHLKRRLRRFLRAPVYWM